MRRVIFALSRHTMFRYLVMAVGIVLIEIASFVFLNSTLGISYLLSTPVSMLIGVVLNWYFSHAYVFKTRAHAPQKEFMLVLLASLLGVLWQLLVTVFCVELLKLLPLLGKLAAIGVTFFWNYWFRKKYIFPSV